MRSWRTGLRWCSILRGSFSRPRSGLRTSRLKCRQQQTWRLRQTRRSQKKKKTLRRSRDCLESSRDLGLREDVAG